MLFDLAFLQSGSLSVAVPAATGGRPGLRSFLKGRWARFSADVQGQANGPSLLVAQDVSRILAGRGLAIWRARHRDSVRLPQDTEFSSAGEL